MKNQSEVIKRIEEICKEFDSRVEKVGLEVARTELAKALAEAESAQQHTGYVCPICGSTEPNIHVAGGNIPRHH